jgi:hypothetical protein
MLIIVIMGWKFDALLDSSKNGRVFERNEFIKDRDVKYGEVDVP